MQTRRARKRRRRISTIGKSFGPTRASMGGMLAVLETRLLQAQTENTAPIDLLSTLVSDEIDCRSKRVLERRQKQARFRDSDMRLDNFDFQFNPKMNRNLIFDLTIAGWIERREDCLFKGPTGTGEEPTCPGHRPRCHPAF